MPAHFLFVTGPKVEYERGEIRKVIVFLMKTSKMDFFSWETVDMPTIAEFFNGRSVLITGGSGFIGKVLIEKLLRSCPDIGNIYVILRDKNGKKLAERMKNITEERIFDVLKKENPHAIKKIIPLGGDVSKIGLGLSDEDRNLIITKVNIIFHIAASVRFDDHLKEAVLQNIRSTREIIRLAENLENIAVFVHMSTAYSNCDRDVIEEKLYPEKIGWQEIIELVEKADDYMLQTLTAKYITPLPNTYTFTKALAEHVVVDLCKGKLPAIIMRPSIVISSVEEPLPGWIDNFNGPFAMFAATGVGVARAFYAKRDHIMDHVAVDNFIKSVIIATWEKATKSEKEIIPIYNCCSEVEISMEDYFVVGQKAVLKIPYEKKVWASTGTPIITNNQYIYFICVILYHVLPALLIDGLLLLFTRKHLLLKIQRRLYIANTYLHYFMSKDVSFKTDNYDNLPNFVLENDKKEYSLIIKDLETYSLDMIAGIKQYLLKESPIISKRTMVIDRGLRLLDKIIKCAWCALVLYYLYCKRQYGFNLLEKFYTYCENV